MSSTSAVGDAPTPAARAPLSAPPAPPAPKPLRAPPTVRASAPIVKRLKARRAAAERALIKLLGRSKGTASSDLPVGARLPGAEAVRSALRALRALGAAVGALVRRTIRDHPEAEEPLLEMVDAVQQLPADTPPAQAIVGSAGYLLNLTLFFSQLIAASVIPVVALNQVVDLNALAHVHAAQPDAREAMAVAEAAGAAAAAVQNVVVAAQGQANGIMALLQLVWLVLAIPIFSLIVPLAVFGIYRRIDRLDLHLNHDSDSDDALDDQSDLDDADSDDADSDDADSDDAAVGAAAHPPNRAVVGPAEDLD